MKMKGDFRKTLGTALIFSSFLIVVAFYTGYYFGMKSVDLDYHPWMERYGGQEKQISDRIPSDNVQVFRDRIIILGDFHWSEYSNTDSMLPLLDKGSNGIYYPVYDNTDLVIGDIVSYEPEGLNQRYVHRIIDIKKDEDGVYFVMKGDNNKLPDPFRVRKNEIKGVLVGILW